MEPQPFFTSAQVLGCVYVCVVSCSWDVDWETLILAMADVEAGWVKALGVRTVLVPTAHGVALNAKATGCGGGGALLKLVVVLLGSLLCKVCPWQSRLQGPKALKSHVGS